MPRIVKLNLADKKVGENHQVAAEFSDVNWKRLTDFATYAAELEASRIISDGIGVQLVTKGNMTTKTLTYDCVLPPDDDVASLLHRLRPFVLDNEPTHFYSVLNLLYTHFDNTLFQAIIDYLRREFSGKHFQEQVTIKINDTIVNSDKMVIRWLNAHEYHRDPKKQQELNLLKEWFPNEFSRGLFISMILDKARAVINLGKFIRWFAEGRSTPFNFDTRCD